MASALEKIKLKVEWAKKHIRYFQEIIDSFLLSRPYRVAFKDDVYFPISSGANEFKADLARKVKGASQDALDAIRLVKPYKGGNNLIWRLAKLNNIDKHRMLLAAMIQHLGHQPSREQRERIARLSGFNPKMVAGMYFACDVKGPLKVGDIVLSATIPKQNQNVEFRFEISFNEPQILESEPIIGTLHQMADFVEHLVSD